MTDDGSTGLPPKQLYMVAQARDIRLLTGPVTPAGYTLRAYRSGDEVSWTRTLNLGGFAKWDLDRVLAYLRDAERREGSRVVEHDGRIVAATFASRALSRPPGSPRKAGEHDGPSKEGMLDYVITHPRHRGRGLGRATCTGVAKFLVDQGCEIVSLYTDDCRLPAIHIYLSLGFRPVMNRDDMPRRWDAVLAQIRDRGGRHA